MPPVPHIQQFSTNGDGTGTTSITADYSSTSDEFYVKAPAGEVFTVHRVIFFLEDATINDATLFAGLAGALTNGITLTLEDEDGTEVADLTPDPIKSTGDFAKYAHDLIVHTGFGAGNDIATSRLTFSKFAPGGIELRNDEQLIITAQDDFTGVVEFSIMAEGHLDHSLH